MKTIKYSVLAILLTFVALPVMAADSCPGSKQACSELAKKYQTLSAEQQKVVSDHEAMKKTFQTNMKQTSRGGQEYANKKIQEMSQHCDNLTKAAQKLSDEYRTMAEFYSSLAADSH